MGCINRDGSGGYGVVRILDGLTDVLALKPHSANRSHVQAASIWGGKGVSSTTKSWAGHAQGAEANSLADMVAIVNKGWAWGADMLDRAIGEIEAELAKAAPAFDALDCRRQSRWQGEGDEVCMDRLRNGQHDAAWRGFARTRKVPQASVRLWSSVEGNSGMRPMEAFWRGAASTVLADGLERAGWRVEICTYSHAENLHRAGKSFHAVRVKGFTDPVDRAVLAAGTAHIGMLRLVGFGMELASAPTVSGWHMGHSMTTIPQTLLDENDFAIEGFNDRDGAIACIRSVLARLTLGVA